MRRSLPSPEERSVRTRQQALGKRLGRSMGGLELEETPDEFLDLLRAADARAVRPA
jgi:hypothetical protein